MDKLLQRRDRTHSHVDRNENENRCSIIRESNLRGSRRSSGGKNSSEVEANENIQRVNGPCLFLPINLTSGHTSFSCYIPSPFPQAQVESRCIRLAVLSDSILGTVAQVPRIDRCNECKTAARPPRGIRSLKTTSLIYNSCLSVNPLTFFTRYYVYTNFILQPLVVLSNIYALRLKRILKLISSFRELNASPRLQEFLPHIFSILLFFLTR